MPDPAPRRKLVIESKFEQGLFASRWLLAPMYLGLVVSLCFLVVIFVNDVVHLAPLVLDMSPDQGILAVLSLIDMTLAANLLLIVLFSGYENFVSKLDIDDGGERRDWMGKVDFASLKMKLIASIVAISGIHLLKVFMTLREEDPAHPVNYETLRWLVIIHLTFVVSGLLMALMDWLANKSETH